MPASYLSRKDVYALNLWTEMNPSSGLHQSVSSKSNLKWTDWIDLPKSWVDSPIGNLTITKNIASGLKLEAFMVTRSDKNLLGN